MTLELEDLFQPNGYSEKDLRIDIAVTLFQRKVATIARAAKIAGVSKTDFEKIFKERNLFPTYKNDENEAPLMTVNEQEIKYETKKKTAIEKHLELLAPDDPLRAAVKPIRKNVTAEQIAKEQGYTGTNWERVRKLADDLDIQEPLELLLEQLKS